MFVFLVHVAFTIMKVFKEMKRKFMNPSLRNWSASLMLHPVSEGILSKLSGTGHEPHQGGDKFCCSSHSTTKFFCSGFLKCATAKASG